MLALTNAVTNIVFDGNSIFAGASTTTDKRIGEQLMLLVPINGAMTYKNVAMNGATFKTMLSGPSDVTEVHAAFETGKQNILFVLEGRNSADLMRADGGHYTAADIVQDCKAYMDAVLQAHPEWRVYILIAPPFQENYPADAQANAAIDGYNDYVRANYRALGAEGYVETRPAGGPYAISPPYTYDKIRATGLYQDATHPNAAGNAVIAQYMADMFYTIPATAPVAPPRAQFIPGASGKPLIIGGKFLSTVR